MKVFNHRNFKTLRGNAHLYVFLDINECLNSPCHTNGMCTNIPGSFQCSCKVGFSGDGFFCGGKLLCGDVLHGFSWFIRMCL